MQDKKRLPWRDLDGIILLDKPAGLSSNQALQQVRRLFGARKAGHAGSLDPFATGMLPICFGKATRVNAYLLNSSKRYRVVAQLGCATTTGDTEGEVIDRTEVPELNKHHVSSILQSFVGEIDQVPPMYSALKHEGKRLYQLARAGIEVDRPARQVTIHGIDLLAIDDSRLSFEVHCSKGTYIRTLVEDLAERLSTRAYTQALHRVWVSPFEPEKMLNLDELKSTLEPDQVRLDEATVNHYLLTIDSGLRHLDRLDLDWQQTQDLCHGREVVIQHGHDKGEFRLYNPESHFLGVATVREDAGFKSRKLMIDSQSVLSDIESRAQN